MWPMNAMSIDRSLQQTCAFTLSTISTSGYIRVIDISSFTNIDEIRTRSACSRRNRRLALPGNSADDDLSTLITCTLIEASYRLKSSADPINRTILHWYPSNSCGRAQVSSSETLKNRIKVSSVYFHNSNYIDPFRRNCSFVTNKQKNKAHASRTSFNRQSFIVREPAALIAKLLSKLISTWGQGWIIIIRCIILNKNEYLLDRRSSRTILCLSFLGQTTVRLPSSGCMISYREICTRESR